MLTSPTTPPVRPRRVPRDRLQAELGGACALGSLAVIALMFLNGDGSGLLSPPFLSIVAAVLWVLASGLLLAAGGLTDRVVILAMATYALAFALPAAHATAAGGTSGPATSSGTVLGYVAFVLGWQVVPVAWLANPMVLMALRARRLRSGSWFRWSAFAGVAAASVLLTLPRIPIAVDVGYVLWAAVPWLLAWAARRSTREAVADQSAVASSGSNDAAHSREISPATSGPKPRRASSA